MTKRLIVHVGMRKTGSTSIQRMLFVCRDKLRANGVHVPETGVGQRLGHSSHRDLVAPRPPESRNTLWKRLAEEIAVTDAQTFVVSAEDLSSPGFRAQSARWLAECVAHTSVEVDVLGFVRPQWQLLESEYSQRMKTGRERGTFSQFVAKMLDAGEKTILDYRVVFAPYRARFGNRVRIFPLDTTQNLIEHFLTFVGIDTTVVKEHLTGPKANQRLGAKVLEVHRCVLARLDVQRSPLARKRPNARLLLRQLGLPALLDGDAPFAGFSQTEIQQMENRFASANAAFARESGISTDGTLFHNTPASGTRRPNVARWEDFSNEEKHRVHRYVLARTGVDLGRKPAGKRKWWKLLAFRTRS